MGDSTSRGVGGGSTSTDPAQFLNSYPRQMASQMLSKYNAICENCMGQAGIVLANYDSRIAVGGWTTVSETLGGPGFQTASAVADVVFTPTVPISKFDIYYITAGGGSFTVNVDGGSPLGTINCGGANGYAKQSFSVALGSHAIHAHWNATNAYLAGIDAWDGTNKVTRIINPGRTGFKTSDWLDASNAWSAFNVLGVPQPHLIIIDLGINDCINSVAVATTQANYGTLYDKAKATGADVIFVSPNPISGATTFPLSSYVTAMQTVATAKGAMFLDFFNYVGGTVAGMAGMFDALHPNAAGYAQKAAYIKSFIAP